MIRAPALRLPSPLPGRRTLDAAPLAGGRIKERPTDFLVEELPLYEPCGEGEHLYLRIAKTDLAHHEMIRLLAAHFAVDERAIGAAGMKDRAAVTSQTVSIHLPTRPPLRALQDPRMQVLWATWHTNKLRRGHLAGNRFSIRVRGVDPLRAPAAWRGLQLLCAQGAPDYFGPQRFGQRASNHLLGALLLRESWEELLGELLGAQGSPFPAHQRAARESADAGDFAQALAAWPRGDHPERAALRALAHGADARAAVRAIPRDILDLWHSAWQSAVFNRLLDERIDAGTLGALELGDVAWKHANGARFLVDEAAMAATGDEAIAARAARWEISPSGPLPGPDCAPAAGEVARREAAAAQALGAPAPDSPAFARLRGGARRPMRVRASNPDIESGLDDHGTFVRLAFDLPAGSYATVLLRELGVDAPEA
ncbi:MAG: tRNA pseudouridine(13) synthase TruD [Phycisphaerales bacterium]